MCLSEPQAGSSLSDITTRAEFERDSALGPQYRLTGNKMWISAGEHELSENIVHLVLAKIPGADGKLVPGTRGYRSSRCRSAWWRLRAVALNRASHWRAQRRRARRPQPQDGLPRDDELPAELRRGKFRPEAARARSAISSVNPAGSRRDVPHDERGARERWPWRGDARLHRLPARPRVRPWTPARAPHWTGRQDPAQAQVPIIRHADVKRMLLAQKSYAEGALALNLYCARLLDEERTAETAADREEATLLLEILTPIAKSWPSQWCLEGNALAIQVHGGYGYTRDYMVEQFYRDNRLNAIHEGTHGIQALDLLGRKVVMHDGAAFKRLGARMEATVSRATMRATRTRSAGLPCSPTACAASRQSRSAPGAGDPARTLANATPYSRHLGMWCCWIWLEQSLAARSTTAMTATTSTMASGRPAGTSSCTSCRRWMRCWNSSSRSMRRRSK